MLLSQQITNLQDSVNKECSFSDELIHLFNVCIGEAEKLERSAKSYHDLECIVDSFYQGPESGDLTDIGEATAKHFGYL